MRKSTVVGVGIRGKGREVDRVHKFSDGDEGMPVEVHMQGRAKYTSHGQIISTNARCLTTHVVNTCIHCLCEMCCRYDATAVE